MDWPIYHVFGTSQLDDSDYAALLNQLARIESSRLYIGNSVETPLSRLVGSDFRLFDAEYLRESWINTALWREAYMLQWAKVDIEKVWDSFVDDRQKAQVMHVIELMNRKTVRHEGLDAVFASWQKRNK